MERGASQGWSRSTDSGAGAFPPPPPPLSSRVSPSRGKVQPALATPCSSHDKSASVQLFLEMNKSLADQLTQSDFDVAAAQFKPLKDFCKTQNSIFYRLFKHVRSVRSHIRRGLAATSTVAARPSVGGLPIEDPSLYRDEGEVAASGSILP